MVRKNLMRCRSYFRPNPSLSLVILFGLALGCTSLPRHPRPSDFEGVGEAFSGRLVQAHRAALRGLGERLPGTESDERARAYLTREFRLNGARTSELAGKGREHLIADLVGESHDMVLLVAAYPVLGSGDWVGDTGASVLVELSRVLGSTKQPYSLRFALAETRPNRVRSDSVASSKALAPVGTDPAAHLIEAGRDLAQGIEAEGRSEQIRAIIVLDLSGSPALVFARDLRSHPGFREIFWDRAARLGAESIFPPDADWASPGSLHLGFRERSMDRILALVDVASARGDRGVTEQTSGEAMVRTLDSLGLVTIESLGRLMERFEKVDAFSR